MSYSGYKFGPVCSQSCQLLTRVLIGKGLSLINKSSSHLGLLFIGCCVSMSDNSLACFARTIKVRSIIYACTCFVSRTHSIKSFIATYVVSSVNYRRGIIMQSVFFVFLTLITGITVSFHLYFLLGVQKDARLELILPLVKHIRL